MSNEQLRPAMGPSGARASLVLVFLVALSLAAAGGSLFLAQRQQVRTTAEARLKTVGDLRIEQVQEWLSAARTSAEHVGRYCHAISEFQSWIAGGGRDEALAASMRSRLSAIGETYGYSNVALYDPRGELRLAGYPDPALAEHRSEVLSVVAHERPQLLDQHRHGQAREAMLAMLAPLYGAGDARDHVVGVILFAMSARQTLWANLERWPTPDASGETMLLRSEDGRLRILFASRLPEEVGLPTRPMDLPGLAPGVGGEGRLLRVRDYRHQPVLAYARPVTGTPWTLVAKLNLAEVDAPVHRLAWATVLITTLLLAGASLTIWLRWREQASGQRAQLLNKELERQMLAERFETLSRYASDAVLLLDEAGTILEANDRVESLYGYRREELIGQPITQLLPAHGGDNPVPRPGETPAADVSVVETEHLRRNGSRFPVEVTTRVIQLHGAFHKHLTIRDISESKQAADRLRMQAMVLDQIQDHVTITDLDGHITYVNDSLCNKTGFSREQLLGQQVTVFGTDPETDLSQREIARATLRDGHWRGRIRNFRADGGHLTVQLRTTLIRDARSQPVCMVGVGSDISETLRAEQELQTREARYRAVIETSADGFWVVDTAGRLLEVNDAYCRRSGYSREELLGKHISELDAQADTEASARHVRQIVEQGTGLFEALHRTKDGTLWQVEVNSSYSPMEGGRLFAFLRDVSRRNRADAMLRTRLRLSDLAFEVNLDDLMKAALDAAELLTGSQIGFFHFVDPNQEGLSLQAWSSRTVDGMCSVEAQHQAKGLHYSVSQAGVWADAIRLRQPMIHNDYAHLANRKGLPQGHPPVLRELVVPILRQGAVVAVLGVGNKADPYDREDTAITEQLASMVMDVVARKRAEEKLASSNARLLETQRIAQLGNWEYDVKADRTSWSEQTRAILGWDADQPPPNYAEHRRLVHPDDLPAFRQHMEQAMNQGIPFQQELRVIRPDGTTGFVWSTGRPERDQEGRVSRLIGVIQDITERRQTEARLEHATYYDALTGLPNGRLMMDRIQRALEEDAGSGIVPALLVLNVDRFAQLNDTLGRQAGDRVLLELARRWGKCLGESCLLGRLEADQFLVLVRQNKEATLEISAELMGTMEQPIPVDESGREVTLTLSIGVARYPHDAKEASALLHAAEDAMRIAKAGKGNQVRYFDRKHALSTAEWFETENALRQAMERGEFFLAYQPQVDTATGRVVAAEALLRWRRNGAVVAPGSFIDVVEGTDLAEPVSRWVLETACRQAKQ